MIRKLLVTTALASVLATGAYAQDATTPAPNTPAATAPTGTAPMQADATNMDAANAGDYVQRLEPDQYLVSDLTGTDLYGSADQNAQSVGEIQNFVVGKDGKVAGVVISTSNLDQNKTIAVPVAKIDWSQANNSDDSRAVLKASVDELNAAPAFNDQSAAQAQNNAAMTAGSVAQTGVAPATDTGMAANNTAGTAAAPAGGTTAAATAAAGSNGYLAMLGQDQHLSDNIIGSNVYSGSGNDAQTIGSVNDLAMNKSGNIAAVVLGVGGFLGIGEKNVGVPYDKVTTEAGANGGEPRLIMAATKEQLTAAPTYDEGDDDNQSMAANDTTAADTATTGNTMAAGTAAGTAAAPANGTAQTADTGMAGDMNADTSTTASTDGNNDRSSMQAISGPELTADNLKGVTVYGPNDQSIGKVGDIALTGDGRVDAIVVDVGGFLGIGSKPVAVAMDNLQFMKDTNGAVNVYTQFTQDQLKNAPAFNRENYAENRGSMRLETGNAPAATDDASGSANDTKAAQPAAQ